MGTNYYLFKKTNFDSLHRKVSTLGCMSGNENEPIELINGWMWNNKYYATLESLNSEYYQIIHIGKSSAGWRFALCTYPAENPRFKGKKWNDQYLDKPIKSLEDWVNLFKDPSNYIEDEYGDKISKEEMIDIIAHRKPHGKLLDGWFKVNEGTIFESKEEYFFIKGLISHKMTKQDSIRFNDDFDKHEKYVTIMPENCTYDLIFSGNDSEICEIFS